MMRWQWLVIFVSSACAFGSSAVNEDARNGLACLDELEIPRYAVVGRAPLGGKVIADVVVGPNGQIEKLDLLGTDRSLELEVEHHLRQRATYRKDCSGARFQLVFEFVVEGEASDNPVIRTRFRPPNRFVISTQLSKPSIDIIPLPPKSRPAKQD